jgi:DNA modification methylase
MAQEVKELSIELRPIATLKEFERNARKHSDKQINQIAAAIKQFGFTNPILVDENGTVLAGHGRLAAAKLLGLERVPTVSIAHLNQAQKQAYIIADNRLAEKAKWDREILAAEFEALAALDLEFDLEITGFETAEIDELIEQPSLDDSSPLDNIPPRPTTLVTKAGDIWILGKHRILCGDARDPAAFARLMAGETARVLFADPPYNVPIDGHVCGLGSIKHREFAMASGEMTGEQFQSFLQQVFENAKSVSVDGAIHYMCMDWRHAEAVLAMGRILYSELKNICVWNKDNGGMGSFYRSKHELVFVFKVGTAPHINNIELGRYGRYRTNVWDYRGANSGGANRIEQLQMHPTVKPTALVIDVLKDSSRRGDIVLDPFGGSGTTLIAAEKSRRVCRLIEIDPAYIDVTIQRWQTLTGASAVKSCGTAFDQLKNTAAAESQPEQEASS